MMVQDRSFGKAGGARGVLNLHGIAGLDRGLPSASLLLADLPATGDHFLEEHRSPAVLLEQSSGRSTQQAHVAQPGKALARYLSVLWTGRGECADGDQVIIVAHARHEE